MKYYSIIKGVISAILLLLLTFISQKLFIKDKHIPFIVKIASAGIKVIDYITGSETDNFNSVLYHKIVGTLANIKSTNGEYVDGLLVEHTFAPSKIDDYQIPIKIVVPETKDSNQLLPLIIFSHQGGFTKNLETDNVFYLAKKGYIVIYIDYRMAPKYKFPLAHEDVYSVLQFLEGKEKLSLKKADLNNIIALGESAGGHITTSLALMARDRNSKVKIKKLVILEPCLFPTNNIDKLESRMNYENGYILNHNQMNWYEKMYSPKNKENSNNNPYLHPLNSKSLEGLPETLIILAEYDYLYSEGKLLYDNLAKSGVNIKLKEYKSVHGFFSFANLLPEAKDALNDIFEFLKDTSDNK